VGEELPFVRGCGGQSWLRATKEMRWKGLRGSEGDTREKFARTDGEKRSMGKRSRGGKIQWRGELAGGDEKKIGSSCGSANSLETRDASGVLK